MLNEELNAKRVPMAVFAMLCVLFLFTPNAQAASGEVVDMARNLLNDLGGNQGAFIVLFVWLCKGAAIVLAIIGIVGLTRREQEQRSTGSIVMIVIAAVLMSLPTFLDIITTSIFDEEAKSSIMTAASAGSDKLSTTAKMLINFAVFMIQVVGCFAVYRGLKTIADVAGVNQRNPEATRAAWLFIVSGVICINIVYVLALVARSMGDSGIKYYNLMFEHINKI